VSEEALADHETRAAPEIFKSPAQFLAFGFGSGLFPRMPGTVGTLAAVPLYLLLAQLSLPLYSLVLVITALFGVWICGIASAQLKTHDHPGIVWDEFVGFWITMWAVPAEPIWIVCGFLVFRFLDILKPWPINSLDKSVKGGLGIMVDDILAGVMACITLHVAMVLL
jgi:phosphatidylglycerophosphatase A